MKTIIRAFVILTALAAVVFFWLRPTRDQVAGSPSTAPFLGDAKKNEGASSAIPPRLQTTANSSQAKSRSALAQYAETVNWKFGLVLKSFGIAPNRLENVQKLLAEREAAKADLTDLRGSKDPAVVRSAVGAFPGIDAALRKEIESALSPAEWQKVSRMLAVEGSLVGLSHEYVSPLTRDGDPLSGTQLFAVAEKVHSIYGDGVRDVSAFNAAIDPVSHLTASNEAARTELTGVLSANQSAKLRAIFMARNERLLGIGK